MKKAIRALILEKDKSRGLVPSAAFGSKDKVYGAYLDEINPRENPQVQKALAASPDPRFQEFLDRIHINRYRRVALATIAKACGIDLKEFSDWWNREAAQQAIAIAQMGSIKVTADMVQDAMSVEAVCERCDGTCFIPAPAGMSATTPGYKKMYGVEGEELWIRDCPVCQGGKVRKPGDSHARDRILEMSGLIQKGKSGVTLVQNFGGAAHSSAIQDLDSAMPLDLEYTVEPS